MQEEAEKLNRIEEMKTKLNNKNYEATQERHNSFVHKMDRDVPDSWGEKKNETFNFEEKFFKKNIYV